VSQIAKSIQEFGFNDPIAVDENMEVIEGCGRLRAALKLGLEKVPVIVLIGMTSEEKTAYSIIHNKLTMDTGFDQEKLREEIMSIKSINMEDFNFDTYESFFEEDAVKYVVTVNNEVFDMLSGFLKENNIKFKVSKK